MLMKDVCSTDWTWQCPEKERGEGGPGAREVATQFLMQFLLRRRGYDRDRERLSLNTF